MINFELDKNILKKFELSVIETYDFINKAFLKPEFIVQVGEIYLKFIKRALLTKVMKMGGLSSKEDLNRILDSVEYRFVEGSYYFFADFPKDLLKSDKEEESKKDKKKREEEERAKKQKDTKDLEQENKEKIQYKKAKNRVIKENERVSRLRGVAVKTRRFWESKRLRNKDKNITINVDLAVQLALAKFQRSYPTFLKPDDEVKVLKGKILLVEEDKVEDTKKLLVKQAPTKLKNGKWLHPSIVKSNFITEGLKKASKYVQALVDNYVKQIVELRDK
jgi:hypothetical protein